MTHRENVYFLKFRAPSFLHSFFYHLRHGRQTKINEPSGPFSRFLGPLGPFRGSGGPKFVVRDASLNSRVLPRVVCLCGTVGVCGECHGVSNDVSCEVFFALCLWAVRCGLPCLCHSKKQPLAATQAFSLRTKHCRFSRTSHGCLPTSCDTRGQKLAGAGC